ncbi:MAG: hypothetical protein AAF628_10580 [Planctomycetota bacterium]
MRRPSQQLSVLVLGRNRQVVGAARSFAALGYRVIVGRSGLASFVESSNAVSEVWCHPPIAAQPAQFITALAEFAHTRLGLFAVFPAGEDSLLCLAEGRAALPKRLRLLMPSSETVTRCLDKELCYALARECGLTVPETRVVDDLGALAAAADAIGFPCIVKPNSSRATLRGGKLLQLEGAIDLRPALPAWPPTHDRLVVQRHVDGVRHNCNFAAYGGKLLAYAELRVHRTSEYDGTGNLVDATTVPANAGRRAAVAALVERLGYTGIGCAQFLVDEARDQAWFLELNPRIASCAVFASAGFDQPLMALRCAEPERPDLSELGVCRAGLRAAWLLGDFSGLLNAALGRRIGIRQALRWLGDCARTAIRAHSHVVWSARDPLPALALVRQMARSCVRRGAEPSLAPSGVIQADGALPARHRRRSQGGSPQANWWIRRGRPNAASGAEGRV